MGYFAVLGDRESVEVLRCHINVWVLDGLLGQSVFYCDVGLGLKAVGKEPAQDIQLALPFGVVDGGFEDLRPLILERGIATLIFGQPVTVSHQDDLKGDHLDLHVLGASGTPVAEMCTRNASVWTLRLAAPLSQREDYFRVRFRVRAFAQTWTRQHAGALFDLRLCDLRESASTVAWGALEGRILQIPKANVFLIVPARLKGRASSPPLQHVRLLEGSRWERYLSRRVQLVGHKKLAVYHWKRSGVAIDANEPLRVFVDLASDRQHLGWASYLGVFAVAAVATVAAPAVMPTAAALWPDVRAWIVGAFGALGALGVAKLVLSRYRDAIGYLPLGSRLFWTIDRLLYGRHEG